jgi:hypothetical protein
MIAFVVLPIVTVRSQVVQLDPLIQVRYPAVEAALQSLGPLSFFFLLQLQSQVPPTDPPPPFCRFTEILPSFSFTNL